jgi:hypothetical protein
MVPLQLGCEPVSSGMAHTPASAGRGSGGQSSSAPSPCITVRHHLAQDLTAEAVAATAKGCVMVASRRCMAFRVAYWVTCSGCGLTLLAHSKTGANRTRANASSIPVPTPSPLCAGADGIKTWLGWCGQRG